MNHEPKMPGSIVDAQVQRLLEIVEEYRKQQCDSLLTQAQQDSSQIVRQAYREARIRMHQDIQDSREHMRNELSGARAKLHTLMMQQRHQADQRSPLHLGHWLRDPHRHAHGEHLCHTSGRRA